LEERGTTVERHLKVVPPGEEQPSSELLTFLIADVRGYTNFTQEHGDEAAAALTSRFADIVEGTVTSYAGRLIELRGDEALVVFTSARQAIRAAVAIQDRCREAMADDPTLHLKVGIGMDAGEGVAVKGGYRSGALNLAARLCSQAAPGEVLISEGVMHLARKVEGLTFVERKRVQLKGLEEPVRLIEVRHETAMMPATTTSPLLLMLAGAAAVLLLAVIGVVAYLAWPRASAAVPSVNVRRVPSWGLQGAPTPQFSYPDAVATGPNGDVYVADTYHYRIVRLAPDGTFLQAYGGQGTGQGQFARPVGVAVDGRGRVYVADSEAHGVDQLSASGIPLQHWGGQFQGSAPGEFSQPSAVVADKTGNVYVGDVGNSGIQVHSGSVWRQWHASLGVAGMSLDGHGHVFATDGANTVWELTAGDGRVVKKWGTGGTGPGELSGVGAIAVDPRSGRVYVADVNNNRIQVFTSSGKWLASWPTPGTLGGSSQPNGVALDGLGHLYVAYGGSNRVIRFSLKGNFDRTWRLRPEPRANWGVPYAIATDPANTVYVADSQRGTVDLLTSDGRPAGAITGLDAPQGVAVDRSGDVFVADTGANRVREFYADGRPAAELDNGSPQGFGLGRFQTPYALGVDHAGDVFVASSPQGEYIEELPGKYRAGRNWQQFDQGTQLSCSAAPACMAVDPLKGTVYGIAGNKVVRFVSSGAGLGEVDRGWRLLSGQGTSAAPLNLTNPAGITTDAHGNLFVVDAQQRRVFKFSPRGVLLAETPDSIARLVSTPNGIAVGARGDLYMSVNSKNGTSVIKLALVAPGHR
jgi:class 3 adenylate cyclase/DNA-binding beta-propeller fold protein YncE